MTRTLVCLLAWLLLAASCGRSLQTEAPGYSGPMPSEAARRLLGELVGDTLLDDEHALGGGVWTVGGFAVLPNPASGKGPVVILRQGGASRYLPVEADGDVADLYRRVRGRLPQGLEVEEPSAAYRAAWTGASAPRG